ncbi:MAG: ribonuclease P protein component [Patescibacteria group bacterium]
MLKKNNRISRDKDFDRVFKTGRSFYSPILGIKAAENGLNVNRLGILINVKVSKKAVERNLYRRRLREIIKQEFPGMKKGHDLAVIVFPPILEKDFKEIKAAVKQGLAKLGLYEGA